MKDGLEVSWIRKHIFQVIASKRIAVSYGNVVQCIGVECTLGVTTQGTLQLMGSELTWFGKDREACSWAERRSIRNLGWLSLGYLERGEQKKLPCAEM
jgi:hypothetical protein